MPAPLDVIAPKVSAAIAAVLGDEHCDADPVLRPSQFADIQVNAALALAKKVGMPPRDLAARIVEQLDLSQECSGVEVSGPGFINLTFDPAWVAQLVDQLAADARTGLPEVTPERISIDYSSPNIAKEMHVGHLRTTVVGDSLARTLEALGHTVVRENHVGDWGTNFGMLIEHLLEVGEDSEDARLLETDPNAFYQAARNKFSASEKGEATGAGADFAARARKRVVALQSGDEATMAHWHRLMDLSKRYLNTIYGLLGVTLTDGDLLGESFYNDMLEDVCRDLEAAGIATVSDGALCVFLDGYVGREDKPVPLIVRKSDGGYGYATTDLATVRDNVDRVKVDRSLYVVGSPQALHFRMVWETCRKAGWLPESTEMTHVQIGSVLGSDRKMLRTRAGDSPSLMSLVEGAIEKATSVMAEARPDLDEETRATIGRQIGIGAIKYADLSVAHDSEYVFDLDRMVALTGNTGPYLQYVVARIRSIFRQIETDPATQAAPVRLDEEAEVALARQLLDFGGVVATVGETYEPHRLCGYLFELAQLFSAFYENCPVLKAEDEAVRASRLTLCAVTLRVMVTGLDLLGMEAPEQM